MAILLFNFKALYNATRNNIGRGGALALCAFLLAACATDDMGDNMGSKAGSTSYGASSTSASQTGYLSENVTDRIFFPTDRSNLNGTARATLIRQAAWLKQNGAIYLRIEGHADERGTREYNLALGARRAGAVRDFLISQGVSSSRMLTISYGKERPVSLCSEESCWVKNRRAVSTIAR